MSSIPMLFTRGSYYDCGEQKGIFFRDIIQQYYEELEPKMSKMLEFYRSVDGRKFCDGMMSAANEKYPHFVEENNGLADGAEIPRNKAIINLLWCQLDDALGFAEKEILEEYGSSAPQGCSEVFVNNGEEKIIGHNNDWAANMKPYIELAHYDAYTLPNNEVLPPRKILGIGGHPGGRGWPWTCSDTGMVVSINALTFPKRNITDNGISKSPSAILNEAMQHARNKDDLVRILTDEGHGIGWGWTFCVNAGFVDDPNLYNIEVGPSTESRSKVSIQIISMDDVTEKHTPGVYSHFNHVKHLEDKGVRVQLCDIRQARFDELPAPFDVESVLNIMGDVNHDRFPIYKANKPGCHWYTNWSTLMDFKRRQVLVFKDNPKTSTPVATLPFSLVMEKQL